MPPYFKVILFISIIALVISSTFFVQAQESVENNYELKESSLKVDQDFYSQNLPLVRKENNQAFVAEEIKIVDQYFISELPENEFLNEYHFLQSELGDVKISIESDKPLFKKENFYYSPTLMDRIKSVAGSKNLPEYRLEKNVNKGENFVQTKINIPGLDFETFYEKRGEKSVKQKISFKNSSNEEININLKLTHLINASHFDFGEESFSISQRPKLISSEKGNKISFVSSGQEEFVYDFTDLLDFDPGIWIFEENSEKKMLVEIKVSIPAKSTVIVDPVYTVDSTLLSSDTGNPSQRKTWWDGSRYWVSFYSTDDERIEFHYSTDGSSWTENSSARISNRNWVSDFSVDCDSSYCFIVYSEGRGSILAREASSYPGTGFSWGSANTVFSSAELTSYKYCDIRRDENDYVWAISTYFSGVSPDSIKARRASTTNDVSSWLTVDTVDSSISSANTVPVIVPGFYGSAGDMMAIWKDGVNVNYALYSRESWGSPSGLASSSDGLEYSVSAVAFEDGSDGKVGLVYSRSDKVYFRVYPSASNAWTSELELFDGSSIEYSTISHNSSDDTLYAIWIDAAATFPTTYSLKYRVGSSDYKDSDDWSEGTETVTSTTATIFEWLSSNYSNDSKIFAEYTHYGETISTSVQFANILYNDPPTIGSITLNGNEPIVLTGGTTTEVVATATVTDSNGYEDLNTFRGAFYWSDVSGGEDCHYDANDCYDQEVVSESCATSSCSSNSCILTCDVDVWFHATPTEAGGWEFWMYADDQAGESAVGTTSGEMRTLASFDKSSDSIDYGTLNPGEDTGTLSESETITNQGNCSIGLIIYGTDLESSGNSIPVGYQEYATSAVAYGSGTDATSSETNFVDLDLPKPTDHPSNSTDTIYWGIGIPSVQQAGEYNGTTTYEAKAE